MAATLFTLPLVSNDSLTEFVADNAQAMQRERDIVGECAKLIELVQGLKDLAIVGKIKCLAEDSIQWHQLSSFHAIQVRTEKIIEQVQVVDAIRAKPFTDHLTH